MLVLGMGEIASSACLGATTGHHDKLEHFSPSPWTGEAGWGCTGLGLLSAKTSSLSATYILYRRVPPALPSPARGEEVW